MFRTIVRFRPAIEQSRRLPKVVVHNDLRFDRDGGAVEHVGAILPLPDCSTARVRVHESELTENFSPALRGKARCPKCGATFTTSSFGLIDETEVHGLVQAS
jgi:hypothetical protein